jgi:hypothetical protein
VAEHAAKRAAFEKDSRADAGAIVQAMPLDIDNQGQAVVSRHTSYSEPARKISRHEAEFVKEVQVPINLDFIAEKRIQYVLVLRKDEPAERGCILEGHPRIPIVRRLLQHHHVAACKGCRGTD